MTEISALAALLAEKRYTRCQERAEELLCQSELAPGEKAELYLLLSRSLAGVHAGQEALGPAELAVHYAREADLPDTLGEALYHLGQICFEHRLYKKAAACLTEYLQYIRSYDSARRLQGPVLLALGRNYQAMGYGKRALLHYQNAYRHLLESGATARLTEQCRSALTEQSLRLGETDAAAELLTLSEAYLQAEPDDLAARSSFWNNTAYSAYMTGHYRAAVEGAQRVMQAGGVPPEGRVRALLTLQYTARALRLPGLALGLALLARMQAELAHMPALEDEAAGSLVQTQQEKAVPRLEDIFGQLLEAATHGARGKTKRSVE